LKWYYNDILTQTNWEGGDQKSLKLYVF